MGSQDQPTAGCLLRQLLVGVAVKKSEREITVAPEFKFGVQQSLAVCITLFGGSGAGLLSRTGNDLSVHSRYTAQFGRKRSVNRRLFNLVVRFIEEAKQCAEIADDVDPSILAGTLIALGDGLCVSRVLMLGDGTTEPDAALDTVLDRFAKPVDG